VGPPIGDAAREAIASLRGYAYQIVASTLAWLDLSAEEVLYLEVAEDFAVVAQNALKATQAKNTQASSTVTLRTDSVIRCIESFVALQKLNSSLAVELHYLTTSEVGLEHRVEHRLGNEPGITSWRKAAAGADVGAIRSYLTSDLFSADVREFAIACDDQNLRNRILKKIHFDCAAPNLSGIEEELERRLAVLGPTRWRFAATRARQVADLLAYAVLKASIRPERERRLLTSADLAGRISEFTSVTLTSEQFEELTALAVMRSSQEVASDLEGTLAASNARGWIAPASAYTRSPIAIERIELTRAAKSGAATAGASNSCWQCWHGKVNRGTQRGSRRARSHRR
jgi:hypothetical protein